jgi:hypothetical protein
MQFEFSSCTVSVCNRNSNKVAQSSNLWSTLALLLMSQTPEFVSVLVCGELPGCNA